MIIKKVQELNRRQMIKVIKIALKEAYKSKVVDTQIQDSIIGIDKEYRNDADWLNQKLNEWINS